jgi:hypothetical protein
MEYEALDPITREAAEEAFAGGDAAAIGDALTRAVLRDDWRWAQEWSLRLLEHFDPFVRGVAASSFGELARIHQALDWDRVIPALEQLLSDPIAGARRRRTRRHRTVPFVRALVDGLDPSDLAAAERHEFEATPRGRCAARRARGRDGC